MQDLLAFRVSIEKSGVILIYLLLYVTWPFSFAPLKYFIYFVCLVLGYYVIRGHFSGLAHLVVSKLLVVL